MSEVPLYETVTARLLGHFAEPDLRLRLVHLGRSTCHAISGRGD